MDEMFAPVLGSLFGVRWMVSCEPKQSSRDETELLSSNELWLLKLRKWPVFSSGQKSKAGGGDMAGGMCDIVSVGVIVYSRCVARSCLILDVGGVLGKSWLRTLS